MSEKINGTAGNDYLSNTLDGATINALTGDDYISNTGSYVSISANNGDDSIQVSGDGIVYDNTISGGAGNDTIHAVLLLDSSIDGGAGEDFIYTNYCIRNTITGGNGQNTLVGLYSFNSSMVGGDDGNVIIVVGYGNTLRGGKSFDVFANSVSGYNEIADDFGAYTGNVYVYAEGDGDLQIVGFDELDTLYLESASIDRAYISGNHGILEIGSAKISIDGASLEAGADQLQGAKAGGCAVV